MALDYANERFVLLYTRDTTTWKLLDWEARAVLMFLLRKVDRAGVLDVGGEGIEGLAAVLEVPADVVDRAMPKLVSKQTVASTGSAFVLPNFLEAQETPRSDKQRQRDSRDRRRSIALSRNVTIESRNVTDGHEMGPNVTRGHTASQPVTPTQTDPTQPKPEREPLARDPSPPAPAPEPGAPGEIGRLMDIAVDGMNTARKKLDPASRPIGEHDDQPGREQLRNRLRSTSVERREPDLKLALSVLISEAVATGDVSKLRLGMLGGPAAWPRLLAGSPKPPARAGPRSANDRQPAPMPPVGKGPAPVTVSAADRAAAADELKQSRVALGIGDPA